MATIIVACDENNLIGDGNKLPWNIPEDLKWFKEVTTGHVIIMGKKTWESLPRKPLPNRVNCILSRNQTYDMVSMHDLDIEWYVSIEDAIKSTINFYKNKKHYIIGGEQIYRLALDSEFVDEILMTKVKGKFKGDKYFPKLNEKIWEETETIRETEQFRIVRYKKEKTL
jgi:dihydrofolate reductase